MGTLGPVWIYTNVLILSVHINRFHCTLVVLNVFTFSLAREKHHAAVEVFDIIPSDARELIVAQCQDQVRMPHKHLLAIFYRYISLTGHTT